LYVFHRREREYAMLERLRGEIVPPDVGTCFVQRLLLPDLIRLQWWTEYVFADPDALGPIRQQVRL
jgi:hypothetical protein